MTAHPPCPTDPRPSRSARPRCSDAPGSRTGPRQSRRTLSQGFRRYRREARVAARAAACHTPTGYCSAEVDQLIDRQSSEPDTGKRKQIVWEIERKLAEDARPPGHLLSDVCSLLAALFQGAYDDGQRQLQRLALRGRLARQIAPIALAIRANLSRQGPANGSANEKRAPDALRSTASMEGR